MESLPTAINSPDNDDDENLQNLQEFPTRKHSESVFRSSKALFIQKKMISKVNKR